MKGLASILVVTRNDKDLIEQNMRSVFRQSYPNIEVLIVDSSDDDCSSSIITQCIEKYNVNNFKVKHIHAEAKGVGAARNQAVEASSGEYIFFVDADCYIPEDYVERALKVFSTDGKILSINIKNSYYPREKGIFARTIHLYERCRRPVPANDHYEYWVCRRKVFNLVGLFDDDLEAGEDIEWWLRSKKSYPKRKKHGYRTVMVPDLVMYEEKQGWNIEQYWKKSMWYGSKYADLDYIMVDPLVNAVELLLILLQVVYPAWLIFHFFNSQPSHLFVLPTVAFIAPTLFIAHRAARREIVSCFLLFIPFLIFYKSIFLLIGALHKAFS